MEAARILEGLIRYLEEAAVCIKFALKDDFLDDFYGDLKHAEEELAKAIEYVEVNKEKISASFKRIKLMEAKEELGEAISHIESAVRTFDPELQKDYRNELLGLIEQAKRHLQ